MTMNAQTADQSIKPNAKIPFSEYTPRTHGTGNLEAATEEIRREVGVRKRLYDKWYADGNITFAEGDSRMRGLMTALVALNQMDNEQFDAYLQMAAERHS